LFFFFSPPFITLFPRGAVDPLLRVRVWGETSPTGERGSWDEVLHWAVAQSATFPWSKAVGVDALKLL
jgi:hypothetical protein